MKTRGSDARFVWALAPAPFVRVLTAARSCRSSSESTRGRGLAAALFLVFLLIAGGMLTGCGAAQSPPAPDILASREATVRRVDQLESLQLLMQEDLERFSSLGRRFGAARFDEAGRDLYARPFPLDLFRYVCVACLNEETDPTLEVVSHAADERAALTCQPAFLDDLLAELAGLEPEVGARARAKLLLIDEMRLVRGVLRQRIVRVPQMLRQSQVYLAEQRAEQRQLRAELERRRSLYRREDWRAIEQMLASYDAELAQLEDAIERLTVTYPEWPDLLDERVRTIYMELVALSPNPQPR